MIRRKKRKPSPGWKLCLGLTFSMEPSGTSISSVSRLQRKFLLALFLTLSSFFFLGCGVAGLEWKAEAPYFTFTSSL